MNNEWGIARWKAHFGDAYCPRCKAVNAQGGAKGYRKLPDDAMACCDGCGVLSRPVREWLGPGDVVRIVRRTHDR